MKNLGPILLAALVALAIGFGVGWYAADMADSPDTKVAGSNQAADNLDNETPLEGNNADSNTPESKPEVDAKTAEALTKANARASRLEGEKKAIESDKEAAVEKNAELTDKIAELEKQLKEAALREIGDGGMLYVPFEKWAELPELRNANWKELGETVGKMTPLLIKIKEARAEGKDIDPAVVGKIQALNRLLVGHFAKVIGKLPTNSNTNGEYTHPINMVNILAGQLEAAELPLSEIQLAQLVRLGDDYDRRWVELQDSYEESTYVLQKLLDEADLKQWFYDEMFLVTTQQQKAIAVPPEIEGMIGLDLYSPGLMLQGNLDPVRRTSWEDMKERLMNNTSRFLAVERTTLDAAGHIFDDWMNAIADQMPAANVAEANQFRTLHAINAGKAQLAAVRALEESYLIEEDSKKRARAMQTILLPQIISEE